jgi:hypothetical protein
VDYPASIFSEPAGNAEKGTGQRFNSADGRSTLTIYALENADGDTPASYLRKNLRMPRSAIERMTAREQAHNVVQFPRELKPAPLCQCHIPMVVVRGEPQPTESPTISVIYRCARCGLIERRMMR